MKPLLVTLLVLVALFTLVRLALPRLSTSVAAGPLERDGERRLADCPASPNCAGSEASRAERRVAPLPMRGSAEETLDALVELIESRPGTRLVGRERDYLHATFRTPLMGYVDDVEFLVDEGAGVVRVRSASRLGHSDLGANARRLEALRAGWERG